ncbi:MAG: metallophosphoesterase [Candidatus Omnitrophica bacterium]|nr:metallophosphoesterase [Candidatus Omnitrophota bacterium]MBU4149974.1 metallophosphoesterase [Candidatus Omnitrophota bacterium]
MNDDRRALSHILRAGFLYPALFLFMFLMAGPCFADFRFAVMGDSRGGEDGINTEMLNNFLEQAKSNDIDFIIFVGDLITGSKHKDIHTRRLMKWRDIVERYDIPVYIVIGNHEIKSETSEDVVRSIFEMPKNGPLGLEELVYSFAYQNAHFIVLDTNLYNNFHRIGDVQLKWLKDDLDRNKKDMIFVFGHEPAYPVSGHIGSSLDRFPSERDELWEVFRNNAVSVYFCGHEHIYNRAMHDDVYHVITGGAGARLHASEEKGGFYHFVIVDTYDAGGYGITVKNEAGEIKDNFVVKPSAGVVK